MLRCETTMAKQTKSQLLREKMRSDIKYSKQTTLDNQPEAHKAELVKAVAPKQKKQIEIIGINTSTREDELVLKVGFRLIPSRTAFSRVTSDLYFDEQKLDSLHLRILHGPLGADDSEFSSVFDMTGIGEGKHTLRVEIYELLSSDEKLACASKRVAIEYVPLKREDRLIKVPIVKSVAGADLVIISDSEKSIYREIEDEMKKESNNKRDYW
jgi:hypothetical protein